MENLCKNNDDVIEFTIQDNNKDNYNIKIESQNDDLIITLTDSNDLIDICYKGTFSFNEIKQLSKNFENIGNLKQIIDLIIKLLRDKKYRFYLQNKNNSLIIEFNENEFVLCLQKQQSDTDNKFNQLFDEISKITDLFNSYKNENDKKMELINKNIDDLKSVINNNQINYTTDFNLGNLFQNNNEILLIKNKIETIFNTKNIKSKKIYSTKTDEDTSKTFHEKCDNIPNTLIVIKISNGRRFGGFTTQNWDKSKKWKEDKFSFVFSLDNMKIYDYNNNGYSIFCSEEFGPYFGSGPDIVIGDKCIKEKNSWTNVCSYSSYEFNGCQSALSGDLDFSYDEKKFLIEQYDVFKIEINV